MGATLSDVFPNPLSGDPDVLERDGTEYQKTADAIDTAIDHIRALNSDLFSSKAIGELSRSQGDVVKKITRAHYRYYMAGGALVAYAKALRAAQAQAAQATAAHGPLADQANILVARIDEETLLASEPGPDQMLHIVQLQQLVAELHEVQAQQANALAIWNDAKAQKDSAARTARIAIHVGDEAGDLNDDLWDEIASFAPLVLAIDQILQKVLKIVSLIMTILAVVIAILSLLVPLLSPIAAALFGYAQVVNLAIAALALLAFLIGGFHIMDLVVVAIAVAATFGGAVLGKFAGQFAQTAIQGSLKGISEAGGDVLGALAKHAVDEGIKAAVKGAVGDLVSNWGTNDDSVLLEALGPADTTALMSVPMPNVTAQMDDIKHEAITLGTQVGTDFNGGLNQLGLGTASQFVQSHVGSFIDNGGLGNLDGAKSALDSISPAFDAMKSGGDLLSGVVPGGDLFGQASTDDMSGDVVGDKVNDLFDGAATGSYGGFAQGVAHGINSTISHWLPGDLHTSAGALGDALGDLYGNAHDASAAANPILSTASFVGFEQ